MSSRKSELPGGNESSGSRGSDISKHSTASGHPQQQQQQQRTRPRIQASWAIKHIDPHLTQTQTHRPASEARVAESVNFKANTSSRNVDRRPQQNLEKHFTSSDSPKFPVRPGKGTIGSRCLVKANHFLAELSEKNLHKYDVSVTPEIKSRSASRAVMKELIRLYKDSYLGQRLPAYDGRRCLYTAGPLPFHYKEFQIIIRPGNEFKVSIRLASQANIRQLRAYIKGNEDDEPKEVLQVLDTVLSQIPSTQYVTIGRSFFSPDCLGRRQPLGEGLESWHGFYQSIRPTQRGLSLNVDISATAFIKSQSVTNFVKELLNRNSIGAVLSRADCSKIITVLKGVKVKVSHQGKNPMVYRVFGLTSQATRDLRLVDGPTSLIQYFQDTYEVVIRNTQWPCLEVGNPKRLKYLPMELCHIVEGQRHTRKLTDRQITSLLKATCLRPDERQSEIVQIVRNNEFDKDPYAKEFGICIRKELATIEARILPAPLLKYHRTGEERECQPQVGQWNMLNKKLVNGGHIENWICINFARNVGEGAIIHFFYELGAICLKRGMQFNRRPMLPHLLNACPEQVERVLKYQCFQTTTQRLRNQLDLLIVILPDKNGSLYGDVKRICETELGIVSQCCKAKNVLKVNHQFLESIVLKMNVKVGGRNTVLVDAINRQIPIVSHSPTIIFGADVSHPIHGDDSSSSIAAVVASQDWPEITQYAGLVSAQPHREELIEDLFRTSTDDTRGTVASGMIREHLLSFLRKNSRKPERIIFYRDGVSRGQFSQVLIHEVDAIRKACSSLQENYQPFITFIVVQKGHHTRLFPHDHRDPKSVDRTGNILPGTVVDTDICHPREFDFYLCSHAGVQGTNKPVHYHVLWDENHFTANALQSLTYNLCYTYARCTRSVSIVPPVYYAHLAAFRARFYSEMGNSAGTDDGLDSTRVYRSDVAVRPLPALKENIKRIMFYC